MNRRLATLFFTITALSYWYEPGNSVEKIAPEIKAVVNPDRATLGEPLTFQVNIAGRGSGGITVIPPKDREYYPDKKIKIPRKTGESGEAQPDPSNFIPLYVIHSIKKNDRTDNAIIDISVTIQISYYRPGTYALPEVEIRGADGISIGYKVPTVEIRPVNEKGDFQDIEPPLSLGGNYTRLALLILGMIGFAIVGFVGFRYFKKLYDEKKPAPAAAPPIEIFLKEIETFGGGALIDGGRVEEFVFGISMIFRKFLSLQFGFDAIDMTTYEIEKNLRKMFTQHMYDRHFNMIMRSLNLWDLSKFAEFSPSRETLHADLEKTVSLAKVISEDMANVVPGL
jgi:hypothetical protein